MPQVMIDAQALSGSVRSLGLVGLALYLNGSQTDMKYGFCRYGYNFLDCSFELYYSMANIHATDPVQYN